MRDREPYTINDRTTTVSPDDAAERLGIKPGTLRNMRWRGGGPPFLRIGNRVRYRLSDLEGWMEAQLRTSTSDPGPGKAA